MAIVGLCVALLFIYQRGRKIQLDIKIYFDYIIVCAIITLVNSKILFAIAMIPSMERVTINELLYYFLNGGIVFYGGLSGVIFGIMLVSKIKHINVMEMLDFATPAFPLFHMFARIGCLLAGCCYGIEWKWGVIMADEPSVVRFPVQFFESICNLFIFIILILLENKRRSYKNNLMLYLCSYAVCRFVLEFYRGDEIRGIWAGGFSTAQYISVLIIFLCGICFLHRAIKSHKENKTESSLQSLF